MSAILDTRSLKTHFYGIYIKFGSNLKYNTIKKNQLQLFVLSCGFDGRHFILTMIIMMMMMAMMMIKMWKIMTKKMLIRPFKSYLVAQHTYTVRLLFLDGKYHKSCPRIC